MMKDALRLVTERDELATAVAMGYVTKDIASPDLARLDRELRLILPTASR